MTVIFGSGEIRTVERVGSKFETRRIEAIAISPRGEIAIVMKDDSKRIILSVPAASIAGLKGEKRRVYLTEK